MGFSFLTLTANIVVCQLCREGYRQRVHRMPTSCFSSRPGCSAESQATDGQQNSDMSVAAPTRSQGQSYHGCRVQQGTLVMSEAWICCSWEGMLLTGTCTSFQPSSVHSPWGIMLPSTSLHAQGLLLAAGAWHRPIVDDAARLPEASSACSTGLQELEPI